MNTLINGLSSDVLPADDRGLLYGDGLFETLRIQAWHPCLWQRHLARLGNGCQRLGLACPDGEVLRQEADHLIRSAGMRQGVLKIIVTRGSGGRGYQAPPSARINRILSVTPEPPELDQLRRDGMTVKLCRTTIGRQPALAGLKHLCRLEQVLAAGELHDTDFQEGLMFDCDNLLIEGTRSNVFLRQGERWLTPDLAQAGVAGIIRGLLLEIMKNNGLQVVTDRVVKEDVKTADEIILTNSLLGLCPVRAVEGAAVTDFGSSAAHGAAALMALLNKTLSKQDEAVY